MSDEQELIDLLERRDPKLATKYRFIRQRLTQEIQNRTSAIGELPDYGPRHCSAVAENIARLLSESAKGALASEELFLLLCAIQFHPIGLLAAELGESPASILEHYPRRTYDDLVAHYDGWGLNKHEANIIVNICVGLSKEEYSKLPTSPYVLHRTEIRVKYLAALLRLGDALDYDHTTVSWRLLKLRRFSPASIAQWFRLYDIMGIRIDAARWDIVVHAAPETVEGRTLIEQYIQDKLQPELELVGPEIHRNGLYYRLIRMELSPDKIQQDKRVIVGLNETYGLGLSDKRVNPYKFLDYYDPADSDFFFGRQADTQRFLGYVRVLKLLVLYGESGVGKTSLIRAGLLPKLVKDGCIPIYTRCLDEPSAIIKHETSAVMSRIESAPRADPAATLGGFFAELAHFGYRFVVFLDQFEEFFIRFPQRVHEEFINQLIECLNWTPPLSLTFVLSLRGEYLVELGRFKSRLLELFNNAFELRKLTEDEIREAIVKPAKGLGIEYESALVHELVRDVYQGGQFNTPHIQIVCDKLVRALSSESSPKRITMGMYNGLGRARKILSEYLDAEVSKFLPEKQADVRSILKEMVTSRGTKSVSPVDEIALHSGLPEAATQEILLELTHRCRLLRKLEIQGLPVYELAHEFLVERVKDWLAEEDMEAKAIYEMIDRQLIERERYNFFLDKERLAQIGQYRDRLNLDEKQKTLVLESYLYNYPESADKQFWIEAMQPGSAAQVLINCMNTTNNETYQQCIQSLARIGESATASLVGTLDTENWQIRQGAIEALARIGPPAINEMLKAIEHDKWRVRRSACTVLARLGEVSRSPLEAKRVNASKRTTEVIDECLTLIDHYQQLQ